MDTLLNFLSASCFLIGGFLCITGGVGLLRFPDFFTRVHAAGVKHCQGMLKRMPLTSLAIIIGGLSLIGIPGTAGFISKWYMINASLEAGLWPLALLILFGSLLAIIYVWKMVEAITLQPSTSTATAPLTQDEAPLTMLVPIWALVIANIYYGINTELTVSLAQRAANILVGGY